MLQTMEQEGYDGKTTTNNKSNTKNKIYYYYFFFSFLTKLLLFANLFDRGTNASNLVVVDSNVDIS